MGRIALTRNKKFTYKTKLGVLTGGAAASFSAEPFPSDDNGALSFASPNGSALDRIHVNGIPSGGGRGVSRPRAETMEDQARRTRGVEGDEAEEEHLQRVLEGNKDEAAFIPTPAKGGIIDEELYKQLYPSDWDHPQTLIRWSATLEDLSEGFQSYSIDEDDVEWLEARAAAVERSRETFSPPPPKAKGARKTKGRQKRLAPAPLEPVWTEQPLTEDDFEWMMSVFEGEANRHVDPAEVTTLDRIQAVFPERLAGLHSLAESVYAHWTDRRESRPGQPIVPRLNVNGSSSTDAYVCFRRRQDEVKSGRKTRRSDQQTLDKLVPIRNDLSLARELMGRVLEREKLKLESLQHEMALFNGQVELRYLKRTLGEAEGDEELLQPLKKRRMSTAAQMAVAEDLKRADGLKVHLKLGNGHPLGRNGLEEHIQTRRKDAQRGAKIIRRLEKDLETVTNARKDEDDEWEDLTDEAFQPRSTWFAETGPNAFWREPEMSPPPTEISSGSSSCGGLTIDRAPWFPTQSPPLPLAGGSPRIFRKRVGRNGRVYLDRAGLNRSPWEVTIVDDSEPSAIGLDRLVERARYDVDYVDACPLADEPAVVDDYAPELLRRRTRLGAMPMIEPDSDREDVAPLPAPVPDLDYLAQAFAWNGPKMRSDPPEVINPHARVKVFVPSGTFFRPSTPAINSAIAKASVSAPPTTNAHQAIALAEPTTAALAAKRAWTVPQQMLAGLPMGLATQLTTAPKANARSFVLDSAAEESLLRRFSVVSGSAPGANSFGSESANGHYSPRLKSTAVQGRTPNGTRLQQQPTNGGSSPPTAIRFPLASSVLPLRISQHGRAMLASATSRPPTVPLDLASRKIEPFVISNSSSDSLHPHERHFSSSPPASAPAVLLPLQLRREARSPPAAESDASLESEHEVDRSPKKKSKKRKRPPRAKSVDSGTGPARRRGNKLGGAAWMSPVEQPTREEKDGGASVE